ncbi:MAG: SGNH/GDSL hydrolase family protein [Limisphaerales bacterium]
MPAPEPNKTRRRLFALVAVSVSLLGSYLLVEIGLWLLAPIGSQAMNSEFTQTLPGLKERLRYTRNEVGLRSISMKSRRKPAGTYRILCLGASTTDQPTQSTEDTWSGVLETGLKSDDPKRPIEVAALGRGGWKSIELLHWSRHNLNSCKPDMVIFLLGINDLCGNGGRDYSFNNIDDALAERFPSDLHMFARRYSQIWRRVTAARDAARQAEDLKTGDTVEWHSENMNFIRGFYRNQPALAQTNRQPDPILEFTQATEALVTMARNLDIPVIVLAQPVLWHADITDDHRKLLWFLVNSRRGGQRPDMAWVHAEMLRYNEAQAEIARRHGAHYLDLEKRIPKDARHFFDDCHFTDQGNRRVANELLPLIRKLMTEPSP